MAFYGKTPAESMFFQERCKHAAYKGYGSFGVFTLYSLISVEKWMKSL